MENKKTIIIGAGGHSFVIASILKTNGVEIFGFYDDDTNKIGKSYYGIPVLGKISDLKSNKNIQAIIGIGSNAYRKTLAERLEFDWINAVHPFSWIDPSVSIGKGTVICAGAIIQPGAKIGDHVIINTKASVDHDCVVGDFCHIAVAHLAGGASIDEGVFMALSSTVLPTINVGEWSTVGAGAVVTKNVLPNKIVVGVPAKEIKKS